MKHPAINDACRNAFTGFDRNDRTDLVALLADDVTFDFSDSLPYGGTYHGKEEFLAFWKHVYKEWEYFNYDARAVLEAEDFVIVPVIARAKSIKGYSMENEHLFLFQVRDGKVVHGRLYADTARGRDILVDERPPRRFPKVILG
jgi:ketosteroid isomerase-like protein